MEGAGVTVERAAGRVRVAVGGSFDMRARESFVALMTEIAGGGTRVDLDLRDLRFIDSIGLSSVLVADRLVNEAGGSLRVILPAEGPVRRMFELTLLHLRLHVLTG
jgi:anti-anti-sigma factor